jgi:hypothetical protein
MSRSSKLGRLRRLLPGVAAALTLSVSLTLRIDHPCSAQLPQSTQAHIRVQQISLQFQSFSNAGADTSAPQETTADLHHASSRAGYIGAAKSARSAIVILGRLLRRAGRRGTTTSAANSALLPRSSANTFVAGSLRR